MSALCREFEISRPTGYKLFHRYKPSGLHGLEGPSRRPYRHANKLPFQIEPAILQIKQAYEAWGAPRTC
ncbi:MAG: leucine zipper domain-containing protein [Gammaproteobacteria bacterium]|jgi:putative transposase|nr:leucine zipper domain-containing protein [Gammaproteobacteria bacterium]